MTGWKGIHELHLVSDVGNGHGHPRVCVCCASAQHQGQAGQHLARHCYHHHSWVSPSVVVLAVTNKRERVLRHLLFFLSSFRWSARFFSKLARQSLSLHVRATFSTYFWSLDIVKVWKGNSKYPT